MRVLVLAAALAALVPASAGAAQSWKKPVISMPGVRIPRVWTTVDDPAKSPGYIFLTPRAKRGQRTGPTILDADGRVVWFHQLSPKRTAIDLQAQTYLGQPVLTWGQRPPLEHPNDLYTGNPHTVYNVIADASYHIIARVRAHGSGINTDLHEFEITRENTALVLGFRNVRKNLRRYGGPAKGTVLDNVIEEVDIRTGKVLFEWSAARRLSPRGSALKPPGYGQGGWDAYHINAVSEDSDGNLLLTARHLSAIIKIDRHDGKVIWRLGGPNSTFKVSPSARFYYPHDAQRAPDGTLTVFDNRSTAADKSRGGSRGIRIRLDLNKKTASLARSYAHPAGTVFATSQGNVDELTDNNVFVGWGSSPWWSEYAPDGHILYAAHFQSIWNQSYRAFKGPWAGMPTDVPSVAARVRLGKLAVYASWNGATQVAQWRVLGGADKDSLTTVGTSPWQDFETKLVVPAGPALVQVQALDAAGNVLATSPAVEPDAG